MECKDCKGDCKDESIPRVIINITVNTDNAVGKDESTYVDFKDKEDEV